MTDKVLIYGATGYNMGQLVARHLAGEDYSLLLGGRSQLPPPGLGYGLPLLDGVPDVDFKLS